MSKRSSYLPLITKVVKLLINIAVLALYRFGNEGRFLGTTVGKLHDAENLTTGVFVGFCIINCVGIVAMFLDGFSVTSILEPILNLVGAFLWITTGAVILQFWTRYDAVRNFRDEDEDPTKAGLAMGSLAIVNSFIYFSESLITCKNYRS